MIGLDTSVFMDIFSGKLELMNKARIYLNRAKEEGGIISAAVLTEIIYKIKSQKGPEKAVEAISFIKNIPNLSIVSISEEIAVLAGELRVKYYSKKHEISYLDCVHLASSIIFNAKVFVTTDKDFEDVDEIKIDIYR